jgi:hypothetical protein
MKQINMFGEEFAPNQDSGSYSSKIDSPIYEPKNKKPHIFELCDKAKANRLIGEINNANISTEEKDFLINSAKRHNVFNYEKIADYYAHSTPEMQYLMERSALVVIDFEKAIEYGFVKLNKSIVDMHLTSYETE